MSEKRDNRDRTDDSIIASKKARHQELYRLMAPDKKKYLLARQRANKVEAKKRLLSESSNVSNLTPPFLEATTSFAEQVFSVVRCSYLLGATGSTLATKNEYNTS
ncbi:hypothetical protein P3S68_003492 [Capsicum galapagoense]